MVKNRYSRGDRAVEVASGVDTLIEKLREEGVIEVEGSRVIVYDLNRLKELAKT